MKKYLLLINLFITAAAFAQVPEDALRYSFFPQNGTARNLAIGGAMGSLGGDINATFVNPAGLGFYKTGEFVLSPGFTFLKNKIGFRETNNQNNKSNFAFGTSGFVFGFGSRDKPKVSNAISLAVTQTTNFNNSVQYKGLNNYSSFSEQFAEEFAKANADPNRRYTIDDVLNTNSPLPYGSAPALYTYLIDTISINGKYQVKAAPEYILDAGQAVRQEMNRTTKGGITELAFGYGHNNNDKWFWGFTFGIPIINYNSNTYYVESDTSNNTSNHFKQFEYTDNYTTRGVGFNVKLGAIYKPQEYVRIGLAVHTPTFMGLTDTRTTSIHTLLENPDGNFRSSSETFTNNQPGQNSYFQTTPFKAILSASYVFREVANVKRQKAFLSADIEYENYKGSKFSTNNSDGTNANTDFYYKQLNAVIKDEYKGNFNFRLGGELKFNTIMTRLGFAYYGSPYKAAPEKVNRMLLSGGLGYRDKGIFIDLTYVYNISKDIDLPYRLEDRANTYATLKQLRGNVALTVGFKF